MGLFLKGGLFVKFVAPEIYVAYFAPRDVITSSIEITDDCILSCPDCPAELPLD